MVLSPDHHLLNETGDYLWTPDRVKSAWSRVKKEFSYLLLTGTYKKVVLLVGLPASGKSTWLEFFEDKKTLYLDATFIYPNWRAGFIQGAHRLGVPVEAVVLNTSLETVLARNAERPEERRPPENTLLEWHKALLENPPTESEGFSKVTFVY